MKFSEFYKKNKNIITEDAEIKEEVVGGISPEEDFIEKLKSCVENMENVTDHSEHEEVSGTAKTRGLIITMEDGSKFQVTVSKVS